MIAAAMPIVANASAAIKTAQRRERGALRAIGCDSGFVSMPVALGAASSFICCSRLASIRHARSMMTICRVDGLISVKLSQEKQPR
ncbi:MAG TPA: hypothetical protein VKV24_04385 [Casimicrobiaceae bacterium]|nr:hypothetical protein [Casimicrobiaceae bacterium]